ncbi:MAG TPA: hypothetical protein VE988_03895 [Gemmataceae bacterium]|nr:hypothetical protein [Gemmataceae bacterium]
MTKLLVPRIKLVAVAVAALVVSFAAFRPVDAQQNPSYLFRFDSLQNIAPRSARSAESLPPQADKLHVILLVFGHKGGISAACQKDCKGVKTALETAFAGEEDRLVFHDLTVVNPKTNKYYSTKETMEVINGLKIGRNDNVLIFQSGHGAIGNKNDPEWSHKLQMDGGTLTRAQVQKPIEAMKPRGIIFLTDCCSGLPKKATVASEEEELVSLETVGPNVQSIRNLVLLPSGVISVTAAEDGKLAIAGFKGANPAKAGSAFTVALLRLWYNSDVTYDSWNQFFPVLKKETGLASGGKHLARAFQLNDKYVATPIRVSFAFPERSATPRLNYNGDRRLSLSER